MSPSQDKGLIPGRKEDEEKKTYWCATLKEAAFFFLNILCYPVAEMNSNFFV